MVEYGVRTRRVVIRSNRVVSKVKIIGHPLGGIASHIERPIRTGACWKTATGSTPL
jgi:hypothetical protein